MMRTLLPAAILVLVTGLLAPVMASAASLQEQVSAAYAAWDAAFNKGDPKAVAAFYTEDAVLLPPTHEVLKGPAEVAKYVAGLFGAGVSGHKLVLLEANACTTYQAGKLFLLGLQPDGRLALFERSFDRAMGLATHDRQLYLSTLYQLWRFDDALEPGQAHQGHDRLYVPQLAWTTGDLDVHDVAVRGDGRVVFVNTLFSCLAEPSEGHSFAPLWQPPWISRLAAEDRCHLNGLALVEGRPAFATAVSRSDVTGGWRDRRRDGGVVVRVPDGEVVLV